MAEEYAHPQTLVTTAWVNDHRNERDVRLAEVDVDPTLYPKGHIEGAVGWNWEKDLCDPLRRDIVDRSTFERLCGQAGIANDTTVVLYGDSNNWFAAWAFWELKIYGHNDVRIMNGGRKKWELEGRPYTAAVAQHATATYRAREPDWSIRSLRDEVFAVIQAHDANLVDVRSPDEFTGNVIAPPGLMETAQRGGHIPGAKNIPWAMAANEDGTFKTADQLRALYEGAGITSDRGTIAYCRIGERSSHTWYVLKYLLGYPDVRNYDGSWTEWGNLVAAPIER